MPNNVSESAEKETGRVEAFSDGVFAVAITLLVLELKVPHLEGNALNSRALAGELIKMWPGYFAFVTSFFTVLIMWVHHHVIFKLVRHCDSHLMFSNGFLLMMVSAVPFSTAVVTEYLGTPAAPAACTLYAGTFVLISVAFYIVNMSAFRTEMLDPAASTQTVARLRRDYKFGPPMYLLATAAAPFSPWLSLAICTALWIFWAVTTHDC